MLEEQLVLNLYYPRISGIIVINQKPLSPTRLHDYNCKKLYIYNLDPDLYEKQKEIESSGLRH